VAGVLKLYSSLAGCTGGCYHTLCLQVAHARRGVEERFDTLAGGC
jgi:hypothetical protein